MKRTTEEDIVLPIINSDIWGEICGWMGTVEKIRLSETCKEYRIIAYENIERLEARYLTTMSDTGEYLKPILTNSLMTRLYNLTHFYVTNSKVTEKGLSKLTRLKNLFLHDFTSKSALDYVRKMTTLTRLSVVNNIPLDDDTLECLSGNLTSLRFMGHNQVTDKGIGCLTKLTILKLVCNKKITGDCFSLLPNLTFLSICADSLINDDYLTSLTNLKMLTFENYSSVEGSCFQYLTNLVSLNLCQSESINPDYISHLTNLTHLNLHYYWHAFPSDVLTKLVSLTSLNIKRYHLIDLEILQGMTNITNLVS